LAVILYTAYVSACPVQHAQQEDAGSSMVIPCSLTDVVQRAAEVEKTNKLDAYTLQNEA
jgi:protein-L-isoaspartate O-methyltransferase